MRTFTVKIPYEYIAQRAKLNWADIFYGIEEGFICEDDAIQHAVEEIKASGEYSEELYELAALFKGERALEHVKALAKAEPGKAQETVVDKWTYIVLSWAFDNRDQYEDPLDIAAIIHDDFGSPVDVLPLLKYVSQADPRVGKEWEKGSIDALYRNWARYLKIKEELYRG